jgi:hypothetical protein
VVFDSIINAWQLRKLHGERKEIQARYKNLLDQAKAAQKSQLELDRLFFEERMQIQIVDAEIHHLVTQRLIQIADNYLVPHPKFASEGGAWIQSGANGRWHLTIEAMAELRSAIRQEKKERWGQLAHVACCLYRTSRRLNWTGFALAQKMS